jgi:hypothetical protein
MNVSDNGQTNIQMFDPDAGDAQPHPAPGQGAGTGVDSGVGGLY